MFESIQSIIDECKETGKDFFQTVINYEIKSSDKTEEQIRLKMGMMFDAMINSSENYDGTLTSRSGLTGGDGKRFEEYIKSSDTVCGSFISLVITEALKIAENNACMKRIVACPTAGSCGVIPAVLIPFYKTRNINKDIIINALFVAAGIGQVIANRATISGAQGGCQAEIGAASAMAAGAVTYILGGNAEQIGFATGFALQNLLGLVCDPVAGLVEIPCVKRNVIGAINACSCADIVMAGIVPKIPVDEIIDAMKSVGEKMDYTLKETGLGGIASTPTAKKLQ